MKEAILACINFLKIYNGFYTFDIWTDVLNAPSRKLAEALGFEYLGNQIERAKNEDRDIIYATYRLNLERN